MTCIRYGNVIASRGSIIPLFVEQIRNDSALTVTLPEMTRFLLSLDRAVDTVFAALSEGNPGDTYIPKVPAAKIVDVAKALMGDKKLEIVYAGIRPGEKIHEIMVSEEECYRTVERNGFYVIMPVLPELITEQDFRQVLKSEYSSKDENVSVAELKMLLSGASGHMERFLSTETIPNQ